MSIFEARPYLLAGLLFFLSLVSVYLSLLIGPADIAAGQVYRALVYGAGLDGGIHPDSGVCLVVNDLRLSRTVLAWLAGAGLAVSGTVYQGILRNPLADPFTLGVSSGAAFGAVLAIYLGWGTFSLAGISLDPIPAAALAGALAALFTVVFMARENGYIRRDTLVLAGIVVATFLGAFISLLKSLDEESVAGIVFWIMGSFQGRTWEHVFLFLPYFLVAVAVIFAFSRQLDILSLGDTQAGQLGVNASRSRLVFLVASSLLAGAAVSVSGVIGFVGLVVPHLMRMISGAEHRQLVLNSALAGGVLLLWSDVLARSVMPYGAELPVGVITALLGGPFFCYLLRARSRREGL
ncbi:MAG: FecCD family ABC transporter permease [Desulfonatronovibrionaceae bacterium]